MGILNDIVTLYKGSNEQQKEKIIDKFIKYIWSSKCDYSKITKKLTFEIDDRVVDEKLFDIFCKYNDLKYKKIKSKYKSNEMNSFDYIKVHINNLYAYLFDKEVYLNKEYIFNLHQPRNIYYEYIKGIITKEEVKNKLKEFDRHNINNSKKYNLSMDNYKLLINYYIKRIFTNVTTSDEYIDEHTWENRITKDEFDYDNLLITYINKCLTGYLRNYIKEGYTRCTVCGNPIRKTGKNQKYCEDCRKIKRLERQRKYMKK